MAVISGRKQAPNYDIKTKIVISLPLLFTIIENVSLSHYIPIVSTRGFVVSCVALHILKKVF